jgi:hypothetical protein
MIAEAPLANALATHSIDSPTSVASVAEWEEVDLGKLRVFVRVDQSTQDSTETEPLLLPVTESLVIGVAR